MAINLQKGQKINLSKESRGGLNKVMVGLGWDEVPQKRGFFAPKPQDIDCDAFAILLGYDGKLLNHANEVKQCTVFFNNLVWPGGAIRHMGDNL
ncbi:MAG: TerD family protein, partial [Oscillospiraceae bacterium]|nr:TerD family protein [Oscillospiraceae bacterium]